MKRPLSTFIGIDLGGARGKTTAVARLSVDTEEQGVAVLEVCARYRSRGGMESPWDDEAILAYVETLPEDSVVAIDAPLTAPACVRCTISECPGVAACEVPATIWLRTAGVELQKQAVAADLDRIAATPSESWFRSTSRAALPPYKQRVAPYSHRCTEVHLHYERDLIPRDTLGQGTGPIAARAKHLRKLLAARGFRLDQNLVEVSPRATVHALFGAQKAHGYKRDADPWETRASIVEELGGDLRFAPSSRLSREEVLRNDHCFEALLAGYTAYLWARDGWDKPDDAGFETDGWIWAPPE